MLAPLLTLLAAGSAPAQPPGSDTATPDAVHRTSHGNSIQLTIRDIILYPYDDVAVAVSTLHGHVVPERPSRPVVMDDVTSYRIDADDAATRLSADDMTRLMNRHVLPAAKTPIKEVTVHLEQDRISMSGTMVKLALPIPFTATATLQPTASGDLRIHMVSMQAAGIIPKQFIDSLGLHLSVLAQPANRHVFHIEGDDLIVPIISVFPPPRVGGRLFSVHVSPAGVDVVLGSAPPTAAATGDAPSAMRFRGGTLNFAKLTMHDTDLTVVPGGEAKRLEFSPSQYYRQLEGGDTISLPNRGLLCHVKNFSALTAGATTAPDRHTPE